MTGVSSIPIMRFVLCFLLFCGIAMLLKDIHVLGVARVRRLGRLRNMGLVEYQDLVLEVPGKLVCVCVVTGVVKFCLPCVRQAEARGVCGVEIIGLM